MSDNPSVEKDHMGTLRDGEVCYRCGGENVRWSAPSPLWNKVMRGNDINGEPRYRDLVCVRCFIVLAYEAGIDGTWRITVDPEPEGLVYETPSGRVWDRDLSLWVKPSHQENDDGSSHPDHVHRCASEAYPHHEPSRFCLCVGCGERFDALTSPPGHGQPGGDPA